MVCTRIFDGKVLVKSSKKFYKCCSGKWKGNQNDKTRSMQSNSGRYVGCWNIKWSRFSKCYFLQKEVEQMLKKHLEDYALVYKVGILTDW